MTHRSEFIGMNFDGGLHHLGSHETYDDANELHNLYSYAWIWSRDGLEHLLSMGKSILEEQMTHNEPIPEEDRKMSDDELMDALGI